MTDLSGTAGEKSTRLVEEGDWQVGGNRENSSTRQSLEIARHGAAIFCDQTITVVL